MNVTVFCSSQNQPGEAAYEEGLRLGRLLATAGHNVMTGGYIGSMEAVSRGAAEAGGRVIGITCEEIEAWRPVLANPWVNEERRFPTLRQRLFALIEDCDAAVALPGGIGTLAEVSVMWSHLQVGAISPRPLVLVGQGWKTVMENFWQTFDGLIPKKPRTMLAFASNVEEVLDYLDASN
jgi:hypothetical protein